MKKKIIPVLIAIVLICIIGVSLIVPKIVDKYSYSKERMDLTEYFGVSGEDAVILLQDEWLEDRALVRDNVVYFSMGTVNNYMEDRFYFNKDEMVLKYTLPDQVHTIYLAEDPGVVHIGTPDGGSQSSTDNCGYPLAFYENETLYLAADLVDDYCRMSYTLYTDPYRVQVYTTDDQVTTAVIGKNTAVRKLGGIKSPILTDIQKDDIVVVLNQMETWSEVKTQDGIIGYVETKYLTEVQDTLRQETPDFTDPVWPQITRDGKIAMAWHQVMSKDANSTLTSMVANAGCLNTISPTWLQLADNEGNVISLAGADYVTQAHNLGMDVWVLVDDFTYDVDLNAILSVTEKRERLVNTLVNEVLAVGADGINIDFEHVSSECGPHFAQFLRELSIVTHKYGLVLSVDNYVPEGGSPQYNRKEQGIVVDYVVIMGYDEHWSGCSEAGSVASIGYVERGIRDTINCGVPASKIINAVPFYTRVWKTSGAEVTSSALGMQAAQDWINQYNVTVVWDEETCQNYGELQGTDSLYEVWLEDAQSLQVKFNIMNNHGVAGMSAWKLGYETPDIWGLVEAYLNS